eukprot:scaffold29619_cov20-Tisochrysis_lutea.AAC.1
MEPYFLFIECPWLPQVCEVCACALAVSLHREVCGDGGLSDCVCGGLAHPSANAGNESHHQLFDDDGACPMSDRAAESLHIYELVQ